ncbi:MAG: hypothetical protein WC716_01450 [Chitinophagaceae bacterium]|jgi:hypothetical protein
MSLSKYSDQEMLPEDKYLQIPPDGFIFRRMMEYGLEERGVAKAFLRCTENIDKRFRPLWIGYRAMSSLLMSIHETGNSEKVKCFNEGKYLLEFAINKNPQNAELRLIRLVAQSNLSKDMNYYSEMEEDQNFLKNFCEKKLRSSFDKELQALIRKYETDKCFNKNQLA